MKNEKFATREEYLLAAVNALAPLFTDKGYKIPEVAVSCGFGSRNAKRVLGECWSATATEDKVRQIFISPINQSSEAVVGVLAHELLHAVLPEGSKHGPVFKKGMKKIGLVGKAIYASPGPELTALIQKIVDGLGVYPNSTIKMATGFKRRNKKNIFAVVCPDHPQYIVKAHNDVLIVGHPKCYCGKEMRMMEYE